MAQPLYFTVTLFVKLYTQFTDTELRLSQITENLRQEITTQCIRRDTCLPEFYQELEISNEEFSCSPGNRPLYRAFLRGQASQSCAEVESILTEWIMNGSASIIVQGNRLSLADYCDFRIDSFLDPIACNEPTTEPRPTADATTVTVQADSSLSSEQMVGIAAGIAAFIVVIVIVASIVFVVIILIIGLKSKKRK